MVCVTYQRLLLQSQSYQITQSNMGKDTKRKRDESEEEEEEGYVVEVITKARVVNPGPDSPHRQGNWEYYVKWVGYDEDEDSWEPAENVAACQRLLTSFWSNVGTDDNDYPVGYEVEAKPAWISTSTTALTGSQMLTKAGKERKRAKDELAKEKEEARRQQERAERRKEAKIAALKAAKTERKRNGSSSRSVSAASVSRPPTKSKAASKTVAAPPKKKSKMQESSSETESEEEVPLSRFQKSQPETSNKGKGKGKGRQDSDKVWLQILRISVGLLLTLHVLQGAKSNASTSAAKRDDTSKAPRIASPINAAAAAAAAELFPPSPPGSPQISLSVQIAKAKSPIPPPQTMASTLKQAEKPTSLPVLSKPATAPTASRFPSSSKTTVIPGATTLKTSRPPLPSRATASSNPPAVPSPIPQVGISTKMRLGQAALALEKANSTDIPRRIAPNLSHMKIKKYPKISDAASSSNMPAASSSSSAPARLALPKRPKPAPDPIFDDADDMGMQVDPLPDVPTSATLDAVPQQEIESAPLVSRRLGAPTTNVRDVEDFLKNITLPQPKPPPAAPTAIQKRFRWAGKLISPAAEALEILLEDTFLPLGQAKAPTLTISDALGSVDQLELSGFSDVADIAHYLKTCRTEFQLSRLDSPSESDGIKLRHIEKYLIKKRQGALIPVKEGTRCLLLIPTAFRTPPPFPRPPLDMPASLFIAILIPGTGMIGANNSLSRSHRPSKYDLGLRILDFPAGLHQWMKKPHRDYAIWPPFDPQAPATSAPDYHVHRQTEYLVEILDQCKAQRVGFKKESRVVFVHVKALATIRKLPGIAEKRSKSCGVHFYTFGMHETVPRYNWGVHEIYPLGRFLCRALIQQEFKLVAGGVVTFTPGSLCEDPWGTVTRMLLIAKHPLWTCYILPSVLGMAAKLWDSQSDPLAALDSGTFVFETLLKAIGNGHVSVFQAPPPNEEANDWVRETWLARPTEPRDFLEYCMNVFSAKYLNVTQDERLGSIETEISDDLSRIQIQPSIMRRYRRFVVIQAETDAPSEANKEGATRMVDRWHVLDE
ncbi:unnamed protein product [Mycena citricolor]|uniref:Chromo domain-containing protein n=1 Tax=Mycena citricolor TaxID=2018698 RepID=A0AAD2HQ66_9AGAR|nr:unnamed protein product [Mycena citricolor]